MALKCIVLCLFTLVHVNLAFYVSPKIIKESDDITIDAGDDYNLTCQGNEPLTWKYPKVKDEIKKTWTSFKIISSMVPNNDNYSYRSVLYITNMSYPFVGFYNCMYESKATEDNDQIYLYVNDSNHLSVEDKYKVHIAVQYQETTIPCRPTNPEIQVELISYSNEKIETNYNPKTGFTFNITDLSFEDTYICTFKSLKDENEYLIFLKINQPRAFLPTPYVEDGSHNHTDVGQTINLTCSLQEKSNIPFIWRTPKGTVASEETKENIEVSKLGRHKLNDKSYLISYLYVYNATYEDAGAYTCEVFDRQKNVASSDVYIVVHDPNKCFIEIREENHQSSISVDAGNDAQWILDVDAHPIPELTWFDNKGNIVRNDTIYHTNFTSEKAVFQIKNVTLENDGLYKVRGTASRNRKTKNCPKVSEFEVRLNVYDKPAVFLDTQDDVEITSKIYLLNEIIDIECRATGNPPPGIIWRYKNCLEEECNFIQVMERNKSKTEGFTTTSYLRINTTRDGIIRCMAFNSFGNDASTITYYISDVKNGFDISNFSDEAIVRTKRNMHEIVVATNSTLTFTCSVSPRRSDSIEIYHNDDMLNERYITNYITDKMSLKTTISLHQAKSSDSGRYSCRIRNTRNKIYEFKNVTVIVKDPEIPKIWATNLNKEVLIDYPNMPYKLYCNYTGLPKAKIEWYKDHKRIWPSKRIIFEEYNNILKFVKTDVDDEGLYECKISNTVGGAYRQAALRFKVKPISVAIYYYITGAIGLLLLAAIIYIIIKRNKERALRRELKLLGLENFHKGNPENLNPELGIDDQAELLPYNKKWEFPIEHLKLGKQLGSGAFGVVLKAEARGIIEGEERSTVAVKMVKKNADQSYIKALASELKIMVHLGKHINVVNLLGACTKNVAKRELLVIVEYCRFGNLQNYLFKNRASFINQVDHVSGKIDYDIGTDILERTYSVSSENTNYAPQSMQDYRRTDSVNSAGTQFTSAGDDGVILSNNSTQQPEWRLNYRGDYKGHVKPVCTGDLVIWSFEVARGMEYLASRKVLHGDLATRNILLADNNVIKICDFGLAKTMYNDNNYKKKSNSPLPLKWMAIESIRDRVFSTQSDVWSFGIVLWELFSLARTPYPGMEADERLYYKLVEGYRMEAPVYAPKDVYQIMLDCWNSKPLSRPSFTKLVEKIGTLLGESVQKHYIDLNDPYLKMNTERIQDSDYLAMLSPPSFDILSTPPPHYVNANDVTHGGPSGSKSPESGPEGYLFMGGNTIFSPRVSDDGVFDFSTGKRKVLNSEKESQELRPMLHSYNNESDSETGYLTPITPINSVSNPSYQIPPTVPYENQQNNKQTIRTPDNYITMPQYKNLVNSNFKDSGDKPPIKLDKANVHYVNSDAEMWNSVDV